MGIILSEELICSLILAICYYNFLLLRTKNNNDSYYSKLFDLFNNKPKITFLWWQTLRFSYSYYVPIDTSLCIFDNKIVHNVYGNIEIIIHSLLGFGLWGNSFTYPGGTILTYFLIMLLLCAVLYVSARKHIFNYCKNR